MKNFARNLLLASGLSLAATVGSSSTVCAAPPAKAFGELPVAYDADLSPNGKHLALILNVGGTYYAATKKTKNHVGKMNAIALGDDLRPRFIRWVNNDRYVISVEKSETYRGTPFTVSHLYTKSLKGEKGRYVLKPKIFRQFNDRVVDWLDDDPDNILMEYSKASFDPYPSIYKVNLETKKTSLIKKRTAGVEHWITDDNGVPRVGRGKTDSGTDRMKIYNPETDKWEDYKDYPGLTPNTPIHGFLKNGSEMIIGDYNGRDTIGLYVYDLIGRTKTRTLFHNDEYDASGVIVSTDGETVLGAKYVAEKEETELLGDYGTSLSKLRQKYSDYSVDFIDQTEDYQTMLIRMSAPYVPGGIMLFNRGDERPTMVQTTYSGLPSDDMGLVFPLKYKARDGQKIPAFMTLPPTVTDQADLKNLPFIVLPHGGPYGRDEKRFDYFAQFFATRGYGVLQMNFRGSEGYGKSFKEAGRDNWLVMQEDVEDATKFLFSNGYADPNRTCIAGWSYGGYAALMGAAKDTEGLYDCVIAMAALTDINDAKRDLAKYRGGKDAAKDFFGEAMKDSKVRKANSPVHRADDIKVPVFIAHGDLDENVQYDQFLRMRKALQKAGVEYTDMAFKDEDHFLSRQENREAFFMGVEKFLLEVNGPSEFMKP
jgi:dipeptidyl aminopeptidase/acylaminoacyl peptidase